MSAFVRTADSLAALVQLLGANRHILSYARDFGELWDFAANPFSAMSKFTGDLFILWDDVPPLLTRQGETQFDVRNFLTFYDWGAAVTLALARTEQRNKSLSITDLPNIRVHVLDVSSPHHWRRSFSVSVSEYIQLVSPWMKVYSLKQGEAEAFIEALCATDVCNSKTIREFAIAGEVHKAAEIVRSLWRAEITKAGDRHAVSNAVGPIVLALGLLHSGRAVPRGLLQNWTADRPQRAFISFLQALDLFPTVPSTSESHQRSKPLADLLDETTFVRNDIYNRFHSLRFALVDDEAESGFHDALSVLLLGSDAAPIEATSLRHFSPQPAVGSKSKDEHYRLHSFTTPDILVRWLEDAFKINHGEPHPSRRLYGKMLPPQQSSAIPEFDILFLDLRLFAEDVSPQRLTDWVKKLLHIYDNWSNSYHSFADLNYSKQQAVKEAVRSSRRFLSSRKDEGRYFGHLSLLPILISICDPSMPIVLFSSSRQRDILELLRPFPNLVTSFSKPAITGYVDDDTMNPAHFVGSFRKALENGLILHEKRFIWECINRFRIENASLPPYAAHMTIIPFGAPKRDSFREEFDISRPKPFPSKGNYDRQISCLFVESLLEKQYRELIFKNYEIIESSLRHYHPERNTALGRESFNFQFPVQRPGNTRLNALVQRLSAGDTQAKRRIKFANYLQRARNNYAHGRLIEIQATQSDEVLRRISIMLVLILLNAVDPDVQAEFKGMIESSEVKKRYGLLQRVFCDGLIGLHQEGDRAFWAVFKEIIS